jgi:two-component system NtrC family sensor kinase
MTRSPEQLMALAPALFDALGNAGIGVLIVAERGGEFDRWYANEATAATLGYTLDEMLAVPTLEVIAPEQRPLVRQLSATHREGRPPPPAIELRALHKDGSIVTLELALGYATAPEEDAVVYVMVVRDAVASAQLTLLEADRIGLVGALAAGFAHEINNPLTSVLLNLRALRKQLNAALPDPAARPAMRCLDDITTGSERIASNVRALQTLATRGESQKLDLAAVVTAAFRLAAPTLEPRAQVMRQIAAVRPVIGEEARIGQAVLAMMLFSASGFASAAMTNKIAIVVEERGDDIVVEVSDNGRVLSAEEARRAFDPFFRSPARGAGVGVGLGVARSVAATLGGEVILAPAPAGGAVITMRLPAAT